MKHPRTEIISNFIRRNKKKFTVKQIAERHKTTEDTIRGIIRRRGLHECVKPDVPSQEVHVTKRKTKQEVTEQAKLETKLRVVTRGQKETDRKYKALQDELARVQAYADEVSGVADYKPEQHLIVPSDPTISEATAHSNASDWHVDEIVPKYKVNGLNEYNPDIAKRRADKYFDLTLRFIRDARRDSIVNNLVLWLGGDFWTAEDMHDAHVAMDTAEAQIFATDLLHSGIIFLRENEPNLKIHVVGSVGNHSRKDTSKPVNQAREQEKSLEWVMYHMLRKLHEKKGEVSFQLDPSYHTYVNIYNKVLRYNHGHLQWRYNDGLGGIHGPLWKAISQKWDKQVPAHITNFGHYHTYTVSGFGNSPSRQYVGNGSLIGLSPYSAAFGFEPPAQAFYLTHSKYGFVGHKPLLVDT